MKIRLLRIPRTSMLIWQIICCWFCLSYGAALRAQIHKPMANHWYFGDHFGLDFSSGTPVPDFNNEIFTFEACATMSNKEGELLFYTNGGGRVDSSVLGYIWNRNHEVMDGGELGAFLGGGYSAAQGALSIPQPGTTDQYYLFTVDELETIDNLDNPFPQGKGLSYFEIDMTANGGLGAVTTSNEKLLTPCFENLTATRHDNCEDYWILVRTGHEYLAPFPDTVVDSFYLFLVTENGIQAPLKTPIPEGVDCPGVNAGVMRFAPDGAHFFCGAYLFDFDNNTGTIGAYRNMVQTSLVNPIYPLGFSSNGRFLYHFKVDEEEDINGEDSIWIQAIQFDLWDTTNGTSFVTFLEQKILSSFPLVGTPQLAPDGKLYLPVRYGPPSDPLRLYAINQPNAKGSAADFAGPVLALFQGDNSSYLRLGNYADDIFYYDSLTTIPLDLGPDILLDCENPTATLLEAPVGLDCYLWSTGETTASILVQAEGEYWLEVGDACEIGRDTVVVVYENNLFEVDLGADQQICGAEPLSLFGFSADFVEHEWQDGTTDWLYEVTESGTYWLEARVGDCVDRDTVEIEFLPLPEVELGNDTIICIGDTVILNAYNPVNVAYIWDDGTMEPTLAAMEQGIYEVTVRNACGTDRDRVFVNPVSCEACAIYIPNAFTPNGDGENDEFRVFSECTFTYFNLQLYDRWGAQLFQGNEVTEAWNGDFKSKEAHLGVYAYFLEFELVNARGERLTGWRAGDVTLIR